MFNAKKTNTKGGQKLASPDRVAFLRLITMNTFFRLFSPVVACYCIVTRGGLYDVI